LNGWGQAPGSGPGRDDAANYGAIGAFIGHDIGGEFRCYQIVRNLDESYSAFDVGAADKLWLEPAARVRIW
jgi:predicted metalloendopeptidase